MEKKKKVCVISDDPVTSRLLSALISASGFDTHQAGFSTDEINNLKSSNPHVAIYDVSEHQIADSGLPELLEKHTISKAIPRIIVSSFDIDLTECFVKEEVQFAHFVKPWRNKKLLDKISELAN